MLRQLPQTANKALNATLCLLEDIIFDAFYHPDCEWIFNSMRTVSDSGTLWIRDLKQRAPSSSSVVTKFYWSWTIQMLLSYGSFAKPELFVCFLLQLVPGVRIQHVSLQSPFFPKASRMIHAVNSLHFIPQLTPKCTFKVRLRQKVVSQRAEHFQSESRCSRLMEATPREIRRTADCFSSLSLQHREQAMLKLDRKIYIFVKSLILGADLHGHESDT